MRQCCDCVAGCCVYCRCSDRLIGFVCGGLVYTASAVKCVQTRQMRVFGLREEQKYIISFFSSFSLAAYDCAGEHRPGALCVCVLLRATLRVRMLVDFLFASVSGRLLMFRLFLGNYLAAWLMDGTRSGDCTVCWRSFRPFSVALHTHYMLCVCMAP